MEDAGKEKGRLRGGPAFLTLYYQNIKRSV
jgi:hypothetical protein